MNHKQRTSLQDNEIL